MIDDIAIDLWSSENFARMDDIRRKYNPIMDLSKFTSNKKILNEVVALGNNKVCNQTLSNIISKPQGAFHIHCIGCPPLHLLV